MTISSSVMPKLEGNDYWYGLIPEADAATFLGFTPRCLQNWRYRGGGPRFLRISSRCVRYRRVDLREWSEDQLRANTTEGGSE